MKSASDETADIAVIIDVFRAFSTEAYLMNTNLKKLITVGEIEEAFDYKKSHDNCILVGERGGRQIEGFDFGNSPSKIKDKDFSGKTIVHTTSCGTRGIELVKNVKEVLTGSLVNAKAIAEYIKKSNVENILLVCTSMKTGTLINEDYLCAYYIKNLLEGSPINIDKEIENLKTTSATRFFDESIQHIFPKEDFYLCTDLDKFDFVLRVEMDEEGYNCVRMIK